MFVQSVVVVALTCFVAAIVVLFLVLDKCYSMMCLCSLCRLTENNISSISISSVCPAGRRVLIPRIPNPTQPTLNYTPVVIVAYMRSGSTFLGNIIQHDPDVFYVFEPLKSIERTFLRAMEQDFKNTLTFKYAFFCSRIFLDKNVLTSYCLLINSCESALYIH